MDGLPTSWPTGWLTDCIRCTCIQPAASSIRSFNGLQIIASDAYSGIQTTVALHRFRHKKPSSITVGIPKQTNRSLKVLITIFWSQTSFTFQIEVSEACTKIIWTKFINHSFQLHTSEQIAGQINQYTRQWHCSLVVAETVEQTHAFHPFNVCFLETTKTKLGSNRDVAVCIQRLPWYQVISRVYDFNKLVNIHILYRMNKFLQSASETNISSAQLIMNAMIYIHTAVTGRTIMTEEADTKKNMQNKIWFTTCYCLTTWRF